MLIPLALLWLFFEAFWPDYQYVWFEADATIDGEPVRFTQLEGRADPLLDVELRPKDKVPCAEALGSELLLNARETIPQLGADYEDAFEEAIENSDCKKDEILAFMREIGAELDGTFEGSKQETFYFLLKVHGDPWWLWWRPNVSAVLSFDVEGNLTFSGWGGRK